DTVSSLYVKTNGTGIGSRSDDKVIFELLLVAVVDEIDAGVDILVRDLPVIGDTGVPLTRIVADKVVACASKLVLANGRRLRVGSLQSHSQGKARDRACIRGAGAASRRRFRQTEHRAIGGKE